MTEGNPLINLGDISKPATVLIEKISDAMGGYFKPYQIKRIAKAEAEAEIIRAQAQIEITDLQRRALARFVAEESLKQDNMEKITQKAIPLLDESSNPQNMEDDWLANFFDKCRIVSDEEMQSLWARVLAGEANSPGAYSKRTVNFLGTFDKKDAILFTKLCGFAWILLEEMYPLVYNKDDAIYNNEGINFNTLTHLDDVGLINFDAISGFILRKLPKRIEVSYYGQLLLVELRNETDNNLNVGVVTLTNTGLELSKICGSRPVDGFFDHIVKVWTSKGLILSLPYPKS
jgi:hypothetical protein